MEGIPQQFLQQSHAVFRFVVKIDGLEQAAFTECRLPTIEVETEEVKIGGLNTWLYQVPGRRKAGRLTLKNGVGKSDLLAWLNLALVDSFTKLNRREIVITLLDSTTKKQVAHWEVRDALPVKWEAPQLQADSNTVAIQTLEFVCGDIRVEMNERAVTNK